MSRLSHSISVGKGSIYGILKPQVVLTKGEDSQEVLEIVDACIEDFDDIGQLIFVLPHLVSCITTSKYLHVPKFGNGQRK